MEMPSLHFNDPPCLADETAVAMLDFLDELTTAFENHYAHQLRRYHQQEYVDQVQPDLFQELDDDLPRF